jgi:hypothetical protein
MIPFALLVVALTAPIACVNHRNGTGVLWILNAIALRASMFGGVYNKPQSSFSTKFRLEYL